MGASASRGRDNESLMDKLVESGYTLPPEVERAMRLVDRGSYFEEKSDRAYMDLAWRSGSLHLSAPSIYMTALNNLDLEPGLHFLNVGSGSGYLSTIVGLVLGYHGINHGIELNSSNVEFAKTRLAQFLNESDAIYECDFCIPQFVQGNIFDLVVPSGNGHTFASLRNPQTQAAEDSNPVSPRVVENRNHQRDQNLEMVVGVEEEESHEANAANGLQDANEENSDSSEDEDNEPSIGSLCSNSEPWNLTIEPPPVVKMQTEGISGNNIQSVVQWPVYDRIYVGAAIESADQFLAVLRLLKIGGVMVAPVRDKFVKLIRRSENVFDWINLLSVSFASLVVPQPDTRTSFDPPPPIQFPTLEQLTTRVLRSVLRQIVLYRQNGKLPTIGKLEEVDSAGQPRKRRNCATTSQDTSTNSSTTRHADTSAESCASGTVRDKPSNSLEDTDDGTHEVGSEDSDSNQLGGDESEVDNEENADDVDENNSNRSTYTVISARSRSPSDTDSNSSLFSRLFGRRMIHSEGLLSCTPPSLGTSLFRLATGSSWYNPTDANQPENPSDPTDSTHSAIRSAVRLVVIRRTEPDQTEEARDSQSTSSTFDAATPTPMEQETTAQQPHSVQPPTECTSSSSYNATSSTDADRVRKIIRRRRSRKKRQTELRYVPPSYAFKDEMRKILSDDIGLLDHYVRRILTL